MTGYGAASADLGLGGMGDTLTEQLLQQDAERRKKQQQPAGFQGQQYTMTGAGLAAASMDLGLR